jgi:hypothetical protein
VIARFRAPTHRTATTGMGAKLSAQVALNVRFLDRQTGRHKAELGRFSRFDGSPANGRNRRVPAGHGRIVVRQELPLKRLSRQGQQETASGGKPDIRTRFLHNLATIDFPMPTIVGMLWNDGERSLIG